MASSPDDGLGAALRGLAGEDARVARIGYQLTTANLSFCRVQAKTAGFMIQALDQYDQRFRAGARNTFGLDDHVAVLAVVPGSPAERAGLAVGDRLIAVNAQAMPVASTVSSRGSYATVEAALDLIQQAFDRGDATFDIIRAGAPRSIAIHPIAGCSVRVQLVPSSQLNAFADDRYASVSTAIVRYTNDDAELAFVIGHELAHGFLRHQALLSSNQRSGGLFGNRHAPARLVLETERQADHVALYMLARAGFDIAGIPNFLRRFASAQALTINFVKDHPSSRERIAAAEATIAEIEHKRASGEPLVPSSPSSQDRSAR
jgi:Zn-dependent protease with chaperone function